MKNCIKKVSGLIFLLALAFGSVSCGNEPEIVIEYVDRIVEIEKIVEVEKLVYTTEVPAGTYTVYHFLQNVTGGKAVSDYTLESTENDKSVEEKTTIEKLKKTYSGFTEKTIAQNETAIYIFYDRNIITYTFQSGIEGKYEDGETSKSISGLFGASYIKPKAPISDDYFCYKWQDAQGNTAPGIFGAENATWTAVWKTKGVGRAPEYNKCVVGDIILKDGTICSAEEYDVTSNFAAAVIVRAAGEEGPALGVGVRHNKTGLEWALFNEDLGFYHVESLEWDFDFTDGSGSWEKLKERCLDAESNPEHYPAWKYCLDYAQENGLTEDLAEGWHMPCWGELDAVYQSKVAINAVLSKIGGDQFEDDLYWTCHQCHSERYAKSFNLSNRNAPEMDKDYTLYVCPVKSFVN